VAEREHVGAGTPWLAVVRPEAVMLAAPGGEHGWRGEVVSRRFAGGHHVYAVRLADRTRIDVAAAEGGWREGEQVSVMMRTDAAPVPLVRA
jgi:hypothetical protein